MRGSEFIKWAEYFDKSIIEKLGDTGIPNNYALKYLWSLFEEDNYK